LRLEPDLEPPEDAEDLEAEDAPELELEELDTREPPDDEDDGRDGARVDPGETRAPPLDGALRTEEGERVYGELDPMVRLGRDGEVRGTMTGRDETPEGLVRPTPARDVTGCRTREDEEVPVLGRLRPLDDTPALLVLGRLPRCSSGLVPGSTRLRLVPAPLDVLRPGR